MADYLVEVTQTTTTTYAVPADKVADGDEAIQRYAELGVPIHSESNRTDPTIVGNE
ncbi:hypothetical protein KNU02_gp83 [Gordonia phage Pleakley]|uniref:Uncharacterized protein n=1 Tax=Gordonia phage Pleakley TaxID=2283246 RepID=A0A345M6K1_9CAUD|nr:hypothetical protein KNU02_gp83 [Gordonia phage Pleakley]AXH49808.1 hypothetical protein SEA_FURY_83 [Gordonia phage Fury]AXH66122.1 hypothetical protein SEA_PLEAKLEY_83 [Gordonia phage Pleakley]